MQVYRENICFILVRPIFLGNIGACARVMKNFGFTNLRLVEPPRNYKDSEARRMSVGAFDILKSAQVYSTLSDALKDINYAVGTTSGKQRENEPLTLKDVAEEIVSTAVNNRAALVFGDERNGLTREDLDRCHAVMAAPTDPSFPALNVAQAVAICAYELIRETKRENRDAIKYSGGSEDDAVTEEVDALLQTVKFSRTFNRKNILSELRSLYQRARPTTREADLIKGVLHSLNRELGEK